MDTWGAMSLTSSSNAVNLIPELAHSAQYQQREAESSPIRGNPVILRSFTEMLPLFASYFLYGGGISASLSCQKAVFE